MDEQGRAFGAGMAGGKFDPATFIRKPLVILRLFALLFSIIVFACASGSYATFESKDICVFAGASSTCGFATAIGVLAFLTIIVLLAADGYFDNISSVQMRKHVVIGDVASAGFFTFMYFCVFLDTCAKWGKTNKENVPAPEYDYNGPQTTIAFSFFSILAWGGLLYFGWRRYQEGAASAFAPSSYEQEFNNPGTMPPYGSPGGGGGGGGTESYQEPPFTASNDAPPEYKQPAY